MKLFSTNNPAHLPPSLILYLMSALQHPPLLYYTALCRHNPALQTWADHWRSRPVS